MNTTQPIVRGIVRGITPSSGGSNAVTWYEADGTSHSTTPQWLEADGTTHTWS